MAKLYKTVRVVGQANAEVLEDLITSTDVEPVRVIAVYPYEVTSTRQADAFIRLYIEREKIAEIPCYIWMDDLAAKKYVTPPRLEIDREIPVGQTLICGLVSGGTASIFEIVIEYELTG